ncbi:unnamed protein product [Adineta steineri]|uniref:Uncharacterized protein n=1 Tax=Adineta steineri TaxID=433720 RepID=A0A815KNP8_9BILA|nr:unnamed protein product [Adineta steineri]CAF1612504.1 unnamed protein product [Adineta steineri]
MSISKVCIITGSSSGLGFHTAKKLVTKDYHVIFACRDEVKTMSLLQKMKKDLGRSNFEFMKLDLSSFDSIRRFVDDFHRKNLPLNLLINNAGVYSKNFNKSSDGIECSFAVNHLGHFLLTNLLLDDLKRSSPSRIVIIASKLHDSNVKHGNPPNFKWTLDEINNEIGYDGMIAYKNSKLANVWFAYELARKLENTGVNVYVVCPGFVPTTGLSRDANFFQRYFMFYILSLFPFTRTEDFGSECEVFAATSDTLVGKTGIFMSDMKETKSSEDSYNEEKAKRLWTLSEQWIN